MADVAAIATGYKVSAETNSIQTTSRTELANLFHKCTKPQTCYQRVDFEKAVKKDVMIKIQD